MQVQIRSNRLLKATKQRWLCSEPSGKGQPRCTGSYEGCKVGLHAGATHQRWANDGNIHARVNARLAETLLGLVLALAVGVMQVGYVSFGRDRLDYMSSRLTLTELTNTKQFTTAAVA